MPNSQPVDNFRVPFNSKCELQQFEMDLYLCGKCGHVQLLSVVPEEILFGDYIYTSTSSPDLENHFANYADFLKSEGFVKKDTKLLDIGSNDGLFLDAVRKIGADTWGLDPAAEVLKICANKGHSTFCGYLNAESAKKLILLAGKKFDVVTANNVFSHSDNLKSNLSYVESLLEINGVFIFEVSYLADTIRNRVVDYIYHEHLSYHSIKALVPFLANERLYIYDVVKVPTKGGSIRVVAGREKNLQANELISNFISAEEEESLYKKSIYADIQIEINKNNKILQSEIEKYREKNPGAQIYGYGACATGTVLSKMLGINPKLSAIIDDNPKRQGLLSPNSHIPVIALEQMPKNSKNLILILAWRHKDKIINRIQEYWGGKASVICVSPTGIEYL